MATQSYYEQIEETFEEVENLLEMLPDDVDIRVAEGVINATFSSGTVFVFSRQPPTEQLWLATPGGGFHYVWSDAESDWVDTKSGAAFRLALKQQLEEHVGLTPSE
jgi:CyaY protein